MAVTTTVVVNRDTVDVTGHHEMIDLEKEPQRGAQPHVAPVDLRVPDMRDANRMCE